MSIRKDNITVNIPIEQYEEYKSLLEYKKEIESGNTYVTQLVSYVSFLHNFEIRDKFISKGQSPPPEGRGLNREV